MGQPCGAVNQGTPDHFDLKPACGKDNFWQGREAIMRITVDIEINDADQQSLAGILGCTVQELPNRLPGYGSAALEEYIRMFLGQRVSKRGTDFLEHRLFLLILRALGGRVPGETAISNLFQTTATESRSLTRAVMSKFQYAMSDAIKATIIAELERATRNEGEDNYSMALACTSLVDHLNRELGKLDGRLIQISKKKGSVAIYEITAESYVRLRRHFEMEDAAE